MQTQPRKLRRTVNACTPCRQSKIKCSGEEPCANCQRRLVGCRFEEGGNKVTVSERYLYELQKQVRDQQCLPGTKRFSGAAFGSEVEVHGLESEELPPLGAIDDARSIWTSPFTLPSTTIKNTHKNKRNWIWLAPSSAWSFTTRLTLMITQKLNLEPPQSVPDTFGQEIYPLQWSRLAADKAPDISGLPSIDHAFYLLDTVKFHLGQNYRVFDEAAFVKHMEEFYFGNAEEKAANSRLWFVQFFLVLAFGKAFLSRSRSVVDPPGSKFFARAMSLMPDMALLWKDSLLAIEVLALAGLYLYSIDQRESAHIYVGQAVRFAQLEGLHTQLPEDELGNDTVVWCRSLWWTLYIMDTYFSSSLGLPRSTQDSDITTLINPGTSSQQNSTLSLQVKLSRLLSLILTTVYKTEQTQLGTFLETTRSILHCMAGHAQEIEMIIHEKYQNSVDTMSKDTRHITLLYHQCVIFAMRPLLLSVLMERLEKLCQGEEDWRSFLALTKPLISTGIKSAVKTLQLLSSEDSPLEVFLPFDLEFTYAAAIHLAIANVLFPHTVDSQTYSQEAHSILDEMISQGNRIADMRKAELTHLEILLGELARQTKRQCLQTLILSVPDDTGGEAVGDLGEERHEDAYPMNHPPFALSMIRDAQFSLNLHPEQMNNEFLDNIGISSYDFHSIVDQIGNPANSYSMVDPEEEV